MVNFNVSTQLGNEMPGYLVKQYSPCVCESTNMKKTFNHLMIFNVNGRINIVIPTAEKKVNLTRM